MDFRQVKYQDVEQIDTDFDGRPAEVLIDGYVALPLRWMLVCATGLWDTELALKNSQLSTKAGRFFSQAFNAMESLTPYAEDLINIDLVLIPVTKGLDPKYRLIDANEAELYLTIRQSGKSFFYSGLAVPFLSYDKDGRSIGVEFPHSRRLSDCYETSCTCRLLVSHSFTTRKRKVSNSDWGSHQHIETFELLSYYQQLARN